MKVLLILSDGMRPDGLDAHPAAARLMREGSYTLRARTVMPSVTLPCHMSLFHSVDPGRHGILTNTYVPQVRPVTGCLLYTSGRKRCFHAAASFRRIACPCRKTAVPRIRQTVVPVSYTHLDVYKSQQQLCAIM